MGSLLLVANWKMHKTLEEAQIFLKEFLPLLPANSKIKIVLAPPFTLLHSLQHRLAGSSVALAAQNCHWEDKGAYTGEVSASMVYAAGCRYVILGHSERRQFFGETSAQIEKKIVSSLKTGLCPILCIGETLQEREGGRTEEVLKGQLRGSLQSIEELPSEFVVAYEPVWAIGTGRVASVQQIIETHEFIQKWLAAHWGNRVKTFVLYGGSVNADNILEFIGEPSVQGALIGGASLQAKSFLGLIERSISKCFPE